MPSLLYEAGVTYLADNPLLCIAVCLLVVNLTFTRLGFLRTKTPHDHTVLWQRMGYADITAPSPPPPSYTIRSTIASTTSPAEGRGEVPATPVASVVVPAVVPQRIALTAEQANKKKAKEMKAERRRRREAGLSASEVAKHVNEESLWLVLNGRVIDATSFIEEHSGGAAALLRNGGKDITARFMRVPEHRADYNRDSIENTLREMYLGNLNTRYETSPTPMLEW